MIRARTIVKICGLSTAASLAAALDAGADMVGLVFFAPSPRNVSLEAARALAPLATGRAQKVALTVDADDALIAGVIDALDPDILQLHGRETPERVADLRVRTGRKVMKALGVSTSADLAEVGAFAEVCDYLLFDAKPPKDAARPGGNGLQFDWSILDGLDPGKPWLLSGGLNPSNVAEALARTHAPGVDVSSGVESAPGVKDDAAIRAFVQTARALS